MILILNLESASPSAPLMICCAAIRMPCDNSSPADFEQNLMHEVFEQTNYVVHTPTWPELMAAKGLKHLGMCVHVCMCMYIC